MAVPQVDGVGIEVLKSVDSDQRTKKGDGVSVHYIGTLEDGKEFDQSYKRGSPLDFEIGAGMVINGWEQGLVDMAVGEKRKLTIQPELAYGAAGIPGVIPKNAVLIFETELVSIKKGKDEL